MPPNTAAEWNRISRVGTPNVWRKSPHSKQIEIRVDAAPGIPGEAWQGYFAPKVTELGINAVCDSYGSSGNGITAHAADEEDLARVIEAITSPLSMRTPDMSPMYCPTSGRLANAKSRRLLRLRRAKSASRPRGRVRQAGSRHLAVQPGGCASTVKNGTRSH
jgi:hypothetical protein